MLYKRVYEALRDSIAQGIYTVGDKLPTEAELSKQFEVSPITVKRALDLLRTDGMIMRRPRIGTVVTSATPTASNARVAGESDGGPSLIGCVITSFDDTFGNKVIEGILAAAGADTHIVIKRSGGDLAEEDACIRALVDAGVEGLLLLPSSSEYIPPAALELVARKFPVVILDRLFDGIPVSAVCSDNLAGGRAATEHLLELGHQTIGFISSASHVSSSDDRRNGYIHAHAMNHLPLENRAELRTIGSTVPGSSETTEHDIARLVEFVEQHPDITGYVVGEYNIALMLREACDRLGREVPADISIVCFDHPDAFFDTRLFRYTHIRQQQRQLGEKGVESVRRHIAAPSEIEKVVLPVELVVGASSTAPRR
ncbi:GntR family transcriptional regulator [Microbacterium hydrocarbonoxydans]|uniref:GntR family transcriptional regulator n=1 Tax=Microbacterium hydrocarbonoxydans TaxID=273678 RepID=UPI002040E003|nr:GntR family transcriptional regulator [Microbacterium hydrocarbonoxydans]MCM3778433.1 GntR family transcriptional regulator [Microbacterium hydrocarbonoxydans]